MILLKNVLKLVRDRPNRAIPSGKLLLIFFAVMTALFGMGMHL